MAIDMTPEQRTVGEQNFKAAQERLGLNRRDFLKGGLLGVGAAAGSAAAVYFGYQSWRGNPVKAALIGAGDEGGVLVGEHNPNFLKFVAVCDVRPSNMERIFEGDPEVPLRKGFKKVCGLGVVDRTSDDYIRQFTDWEALQGELLANKDIEAVVIALPLHLHAPVAVRAMQIGKARGKPIHVLCEKLMAWNIRQCKQMIKVAKDTGSILSIGHQRHYSLIYSHASEVVKAGTLGDIKHIRALWHRNFSWPYYPTGVNPDDPKNRKIVARNLQADRIPLPTYRDGWFQPVRKSEQEALSKRAQDANMTLEQLMEKYHYKDLAQLVRWRLYAETGGGLMAELGSHQLDACSIFLGKVHPLAVQGVGCRSFFGPNKNDRDIDDHVFVTYEFPGKNHPKGPARPDGSHGNDPSDIVVVTYSSVSTNSFEQYGECLMGTRGSMVVEAEQRVMLYTEKSPISTVKDAPRTMTVDVSKLPAGKAAAEASSTWGGVAAASPASTASSGASGAPASRGYREEMEDFAFCVREWDARQGYAKDAAGKYVQRLPRCHGEVAMADAIVALTANRAMKDHNRITFDEKWFQADEEAVPDDPSARPKVEVQMG